MTTVRVAGNYLDPSGHPVIATRLPESDRNIVGGMGPAIGWVCRWIQAADDAADVMTGVHQGVPVIALVWDHGTTRHTLNQGQWVVWTGHQFRVLDDHTFARDYADMSYETSDSEDDR